MLPFIVLLLATLLFRLLGVIGVPLFSTWHAASTWGLAAMLLLTASAHFNAMKGDLIKMVPRQFPFPNQIVQITGILEILGAIGLLIPLTRTAAGICLAILFVAMLPANINAARHAVTLRGRAATSLWLRIPMQVIFIAVALWGALG
jgi:uncharacterized membrane protein